MNISACFPRNFGSFLGSKNGFERGVFFATKGGIVYKKSENLTNQGFGFCYQGSFCYQGTSGKPATIVGSKVAKNIEYKIINRNNIYIG